MIEFDNKSKRRKYNKMNATVNSDEVNDPYIYLDWNVFKYMKTSVLNTKSWMKNFQN